MTPSISIFPIRHHGPGSARSLEHALAQLNPDVLLVEGPSDADSVLPFLAQEDMKPPVALLGYVNDDPSRAVFWPFAAFSPEFVAFRWAARAGAAARFMDLPASVSLAGERGDDDVDDLHSDPLRVLAEAAGYADFERWWETLVEARGDDFEVFDAINEAMRAVRADAPAASGREAQREACMRQAIRAALKGGAQRVAVVCGAWHAPALDVEAFTAKDDAALLKGLPKAKVTLTWVPWTHGRLSTGSGYGAGVPCIYYGTEIGLSQEVAAAMPFCRAPMPWTDHGGDPAAWDMDLRSDVQRLIALRRATPALQRGSMRVLAAQDDTFGYVRELDGVSVAVLASRGAAEPVTVTLPDGEWRDALSGEPVGSGVQEIVLNAGRILISGD